MKIELKVMDASVRMVTFSLVVAGTVTSLFFPPIGLSILLAAGLGGAIYIFGRLVAPHVPTFQSSFKETSDIPTLYTEQEVKGSTSSLLNGLGKVAVHQSPQRAQTESKPSVGDKAKQSKNSCSDIVSSITTEPQPFESENLSANTRSTESCSESTASNRRR